MQEKPSEASNQAGLNALRGNLQGLSKEMQKACNNAAENACMLINLVHSQRLHLMQRSAPFAAVNINFARASDAAGKTKKKKVKETSKDGSYDNSNVDNSVGQQQEKAATNDQAEAIALKQKAKEEELERRKEEKRLASERRRRDAEARRRAADEKKQEAKRQLEAAEKKQAAEQQRKEEKQARQEEKEAKREDREVQRIIFQEAKRILKRQVGESDFVRSLDEVQFEEGELDRSRTLTGLHPVSKEDWNDAYDELVRSTMADCGDNSLEDRSFMQVLDEAERERKRKEMSADEPGIRTKLREEIYDEMTGEELSRHDPKMELKPEEHDALALDRFGQGFFLHPKRLLGFLPWGVVHDISWGMFGHIPTVRERLGPKWGGQDPRIVLQRQDFYDDILNIAPEMEMTVMMVAERDIPVEELRNKLLDMQHIRLRQVMYREEHLKPLARKHRVLLAKLKLSTMEHAFKNSGLMDRKGNIKRNSKLILVVTEDGALTAEGVTPGTVSEQQVVRLGRWTDTTFARSVMDNFLGLFPADSMGKNAVGNGVLYCANGFDYQAPERSGNPYQLYNSLPSQDVPEHLSRPSEQEGFLLSPEIFTVDHSRPLVIDDIGKAAKRPPAALQPAS